MVMNDQGGVVAQRHVIYYLTELNNARVQDPLLPMPSLLSVNLGFVVGYLEMLRVVRPSNHEGSLYLAPSGVRAVVSAVWA